MEEEKMRLVPQMNSKHTETHPFSTDVLKQTLLPSSLGYKYISDGNALQTLTNLRTQGGDGEFPFKQ